VVASEVKTLAAQAANASKELGEIRSSTSELHRRFAEKESDRLSEMSQTLVQLIVRNLYERTADVRWWATDDALFRCVESSDRASIDHAVARLGLINRFYSVYLNLVLVGIDGKVIACSQPAKFPKVTGADFSTLPWFRKAMATTNGDQYVVDDIDRDPSHDDKLTAVYAASVRKAGDIDGKIIGVLGVIFDWEAQATTIVRTEPSHYQKMNGSAAVCSCWTIGCALLPRLIIVEFSRRFCLNIMDNTRATITHKLVIWKTQRLRCPYSMRVSLALLSS
jgi:hypothetical protein